MNSFASRRPGAFIDRDGVINEERAYVHSIDDFVLLPNAIEGLLRLQSLGFVLVVVTNQAGIARGYYDLPDLERLHSHMRAELEAAGVRFGAIKYCPHHPEGAVFRWRTDCDCRKPAPGMILEAARELNLDIACSVMIGDKRSDVQAGRAADVRNCVLVRSGHALGADDGCFADATCIDLLDAANWIAAQLSTKTPK